MKTNRTELKRLARQLTIAQAGITALASGYAHDGRQMPEAERVLDKSLEAAIAAGELAQSIRSQKDKL